MAFTCPKAGRCEIYFHSRVEWPGVLHLALSLVQAQSREECLWGLVIQMQPCTHKHANVHLMYIAISVVCGTFKFTYT